MSATAKSTPILPVLSVNFIGVLGYSIIMPFLVFLVNRFGGDEVVYGVLGSVYPAFQLFGAPVLGRWSDTFGRKRILLLSQIGTLLSWLVFLAALYLPVRQLFNMDIAGIGAVSLTLPLFFLFIARAFDGLTGGNVSVANAYLSDISNDENRKANFGKMAMSSSLGFIIGPSLAGLLGSTRYKETLPVLAAIVISAVAIYLIWFRLPESETTPVRPPGYFSLKKIFGFEHKECYRIRRSANSGVRGVFAITHMPFLILIYFLTFLGFSVFYTAFPIHALKVLSWDTFRLGIFFSVLSGMMILVQGPVLGILSKKFSDASLVISGSVLLAINFSFMVSGNEWLIYTAAILFAFGNGLMWPSYLSILSKAGGEKQQGSVQGVANSSGSLASIVGLVLGGYLYKAIGPATFYMAAAMLFMISLLSFRMLKFQTRRAISG